MTNKAMLMKQLAQVSFSMDELRLFLDTHPKNREALSAFAALGKKRRELVERYEEHFGPLDSYGAVGDEWSWVQHPWPWEKGV